MAGLDRFLRAQNDAGTYSRALAELRAGAKRSHWMWFVFPQLRGLGRSETARHFGIMDAGEASAFLAHPTLGERLQVCTAAMLDWAERRSVVTILGSVDALKFASSMTLFEAVGRDAAFAQALDRLCGGQRDRLTLDLLSSRQ
ncbi:MAG: DUF1810 domain-containing protein [Novosphingobium sp.]